MSVSTEKNVGNNNFWGKEGDGNIQNDDGGECSDNNEGGWILGSGLGGCGGCNILK